MDFGQALEVIKKSGRVRRKGWNGKDMYLSMCWGGGFRDGYRIENYIYMKTAQENIIPWLASQSDMLSEDWERC